MPGVLRTTWYLTKRSVVLFIDDGALSRGAAIAFYAITSLGPILLIAVAVAGLAYGEQAARGVLIGKLAGFMGQQSASFLQTAIRSAWRHGSSTFTSVLGLISLIVTATGLFLEMQAALNAIWNVTPPPMTVWGLVRDRLLSLALVFSLAVVLLLTVLISAVLNALQATMPDAMPLASVFLQACNVVLGLAILTFMVGAVYKVLPDKYLRWRDVGVGAFVTAVLISLGKTLIGAYIGHTGIASSYGAAGSVVAVLLWIYYSTQIFLLGAEFTSVYADHRAEVRRSRYQSAPPSGREPAELHRASPPEG